MNWMDFYSITCQKLLHFAIERRDDDPQLDLDTTADWAEMFAEFEAPTTAATPEEGDGVMRDVMTYVSDGRWS